MSLPAGRTRAYGRDLKFFHKGSHSSAADVKVPKGSGKREISVKGLGQELTGTKRLLFHHSLSCALAQRQRHLTLPLNLSKDPHSKLL